MKHVMERLFKGSFATAFVSILLGLLLAGVILMLGGYNPFTAYGSLFAGIFGSPYLMGETIRQITPLILTGLSVAFAFRTGLFNIGTEGQFMVGQLAAVAVGSMINLPWFLHVPTAIMAAILAGGIWGAIPGYLKAKRGVHEVITTIMMNWIGLILVNHLIRTYLKGQGERTVNIHDTASLSVDWLSQLFGGARIHLGIVVALLAAVLMYFLLWRTTKGFELRAVGHNIHGAEYAGMKVNQNMVLSMAISGAFAGIAGASEGLGVYGYMAISATFPGFGFDGIAVALIGGNTSIGIILGAILFGGLTFGAKSMQMAADVPYEIIRIVIALVIFFVASSGFVSSLIDKVIKPFTGGKKGGATHGNPR
ncbi:ABC transporter permease [Brevibacillus sp. H7]|uniref:ABC transporter permease n=1 Tax=Brevibacillus sp. H7 TaxID=3349138 RepID=UPI0038123ABE